jgi:hypothetical protein
MHTQIVMDNTGDSRHRFDPNNYVEVLRIVPRQRHHRRPHGYTR